MPQESSAIARAICDLAGLHEHVGCPHVSSCDRRLLPLGHIHRYRSPCMSGPMPLPLTHAKSWLWLLQQELQLKSTCKCTCTCLWRLPVCVTKCMYMSGMTGRGVCIICTLLCASSACRKQLSVVSTVPIEACCPPEELHSRDVLRYFNLLHVQ